MSNYTINGTILLKITREELELLVNSLKTIVQITKNKHENSGIYTKLLESLYYVEKQWEKEEEKYKKSKGFTKR